VRAAVTRLSIVVLAIGFSDPHEIRAQVAPARADRPTAAELVARIKEHAGVTLLEKTVDTFKAGDPQTRVRGIAVTMMATLDVLKRAAARGDNFVITHEPTFYGHVDSTGTLAKENDPVLAAKQKFIEDHGLVVWRFHDTPHSMQPDMINAGMAHALGWESRRHNGSPVVFDLPATTLGALAITMGAKLGARAIRISGNPSARISRVAFTQGFPGFAANRHAIQSGGIDAAIIGEDHEWETIEYVVDAISAGQMKGLIVLGHIPSEQAGMEEFTRWLRKFVTEVPIEFVSTPDPFTTHR
jgi:putative NIF3 family GTP cyclohydrolase 1 type 2